MTPKHPISPVRIKPGVSIIFFIIILISLKPVTAESQVLRGLANNTFAGTINGALLGGATMAITNSDNFAPVRFGIGLGTLSGMGVGIYDAGMNRYGYIEGTFHTTSNSGYIILTDTFYGAATGSIIGIAVSLLGNSRVAIGAQYGAGIGAWTGFSFGLADAFYLSRRSTGIDYFSSATEQAAGLIQWQPGTQSSIGFLNPSVYAFPGSNGQSLGLNSQWGVELANVSFRF